MEQLTIYDYLKDEESSPRGCGRSCKTVWTRWCSKCGQAKAWKAKSEDCKQEGFYCGYGGLRPCKCTIPIWEED